MGHMMVMCMPQGLFSKELSLQMLLVGKVVKMIKQVYDLQPLNNKYLMCLNVLLNG